MPRSGRLDHLSITCPFLYKLEKVTRCEKTWRKWGMRMEEVGLKEEETEEEGMCENDSECVC